MDKNDYAFYEDQKGPRQGKCTNAVEKLAESDQLHQKGYIQRKRCTFNKFNQFRFSI